MRIRPLNDTLIVKLEDDQWMYINKPELIEIPDGVIGAFKKRSQWGNVVSWGNRCKYKYQEGERVFFKWYDHRPGWKEGSDDFRFVQEEELLAKDEDVRP